MKRGQEKEKTMELIATLKMGQYKPTALDAAKEAAAYRLTAVYGKKTEVTSKDGVRVLMTDKQLAALKQTGALVVCDF